MRGDSSAAAPVPIPFATLSKIAGSPAFPFILVANTRFKFDGACCCELGFQLGGAGLNCEGGGDGDESFEHLSVLFLEFN